MGLKKVYIDTNFWIYFLEANKKFGPKSKEIFKYLIDKKVEIFVSALTYTECLVIPFKDDDNELEMQYVELLQRFQNIKIIDLNSKIGINAAFIRAKFETKTPDAIHLATAVESKCEVFISNDIRLKKFSNIEILTINNFRERYCK